MVAWGTIRVSVLGNGVVETRASGILAPAQIRSWVAEISALRNARGHFGLWLIDALEVEAIIPGSTGAVVTFARQRNSPLHAVAVVTRLPLLIGLSRVFSVVAPRVNRRVFGTRSAALEFLDGIAPPGATVVALRRGAEAGRGSARTPGIRAATRG